MDPEPTEPMCAADRLADVLENLFALPADSVGEFVAVVAMFWGVAYVLRLLLRESRFSF